MVNNRHTSGTTKIGRISLFKRQKGVGGGGEK
jgi:hypothetical protein